MSKPQDQVDVALVRFVDAVRRLAPARLHAEPGSGSTSRVEMARVLASALMIATQGIEDADHATAPLWRSLPDVADLVVGDQLSVMAHDFVAARARANVPSVWTPAGRAPMSDVVEQILSLVAQFQAQL